MKDMRIRWIAIVCWLMIQFAAEAQNRSRGNEGESSLMNIVWSVVPIVIIAIFIWFFFVRGARKNQDKTEEYIKAQRQHEARMEHFLERIALALEGKSGSKATAVDRATCAECGGVFNVQDMIKYEDRYICARCKPILFQKIGEGAKLGGP
jgi:ribosomal protein S27AE